MTKYLPLIGRPVLDSDGKQIGFVDQRTPADSLLVTAPGSALVIVDLNSDASKPSISPGRLDSAVRRAISWRSADDKRLHREIDKHFPQTVDHDHTVSLYASLLVIRGGKFPKDLRHRKLALFSRKHLVEKGSSLRTPSWRRSKIPGWTDKLHLVNLTTYVGQARPWIYRRTPYLGSQHVNPILRFQFASGTEVVPVFTKIIGGSEPYENIQLYPDYKDKPGEEHYGNQPKEIYSTDRGIIWHKTSWSESFGTARYPDQVLPFPEK